VLFAIPVAIISLFGADVLVAIAFRLGLTKRRSLSDRLPRSQGPPRPSVFSDPGRAGASLAVDAHMRILRAMETPGPLMETFGAVGVALVFLYLAAQGKEDRLSITAFGSVLVAMFAMYRPIKQLARLQNTFLQAQAASQRVFELLAMKSAIAAKHATAKRILTCPQSILRLYEILEVRCLDQIAARLIDARQATADRAWLTVDAKATSNTDRHRRTLAQRESLHVIV